MIARPLEIQAEANLLEVMPWMMNNIVDDPAFEMQLLWMFIDPFKDWLADYDYGNPDEDATLSALYTARRYFPEDYAIFGEWYRTMPYQAFELALHDHMRNYFPSQRFDHYRIPDAHFYTWVPLAFYGIGFESHEFEMYASVFSSDAMRDFLAMFDMAVNEEELEDHCKNDAARNYALDVIIASLHQETVVQQTPVFDNIAMILRWFWSKSHNTLIDNTEESFSENYGYEHSTWDRLDFLTGIQMQADDLIEMTFAGIKALESDPILLNAVVSNYRTVYRAYCADLHDIDKDNLWRYNNLKEKLNEAPTGHIHWSELNHASRGCLTDSQTHYRDIRFWRDDAYTDSLFRR